MSPVFHSGPTGRSKKKRGLTDTSRLFYLFTAPWALGFLAFTLLPMAISLVTSFSNWNAISSPVFNGLANYKEIFTTDFNFWDSVRNTLYYVGVSVPLNTVVALVLAMMLNRKLPGTNLFRAVFYMPSMIAGVAIYLTWLYMYSPDTGVINELLGYIGIQGPRWLTDYKTAMPSLILMNAFSCGGAMIIFLAGLQDIPSDYYEAARIDGANALSCFFRITVPMLSPVIFFNVLMGIVNGLQIFTQPHVMTGGGPANATYVYGLHLYSSAFKFYRFGYASALAWVLFLVILGITSIILRTSSTWVYYREDVD